MIKLTNLNLCDSLLPNRTVFPAVASNHVKGSGHKAGGSAANHAMSERKEGNLSAHTANSFPYLHRLYQFPWHHSLHNRKLHHHRRDNCFIVPTLQWALSWDIQQWTRRRFGHWLCSRIQGTDCHDTEHICY